jgi:2-deoxy-D-gluconate 3-dehydrogenase
MTQFLKGTPKAELIRRKTPARRWGNAEDVVGTAIFLAAPASDFVTGASIPVDGGYSITDQFVYEDEEK